MQPYVSQVSFSANAPVLSVAADVMGGNFTVAKDRVKLVGVMVPLLTTSCI